MTVLSDLHTHSTASDGQYTPAQLVGLAKDKGLQVLALTDHDTVDGLKEAMETGARLDLRVLGGIELSAKEYDTFHILGYGFSPDDPGIQGLCRRMRARRDDRKAILLSYLAEKGVELSLDQVERIAGGDIIARPHFAQAMVRAGYVATVREAFDRYLNTQEFHQRVDRGKPSAQECVTTIRAAGGVAALAHPYQIGLDQDALTTLVETLTGFGLNAIECYYPRHTAAQTACYLGLAARFGLGVTGGSDFHGERVKPDIHLASLALDLDWLLGP